MRGEDAGYGLRARKQIHVGTGEDATYGRENYVSQTPWNQEEPQILLKGVSNRKGRMFGINIVLNYLHGLDDQDAMQTLEEHHPGLSHLRFSTLPQDDRKKARKAIEKLAEGFIACNKENIRSGEFNETMGSYYEGVFLNNQKHGEGKFVFDNGDVYLGQFKKDFISGIGKKAVYHFKEFIDSRMVEFMKEIFTII